MISLQEHPATMPPHSKNGSLYSDWETHQFLIAVRAADEDNDWTRLIKLLRSQEPLSGLARYLIAELLERHRFKKPRGGRRVPLYKMSEREAALHAAKQEYELAPPSPGERLAKIRYIADAFGISSGTLENFLSGKRGASRRKR